MKQVLGLIVLVAMLSGCSTYSTNRYSISVDNVVALRTLNGKTINVGDFSSSVPGQSEIMCRGVGPIKTPDGEPFSEFIRKSLLDELQIANVFSPTSTTTLTVHLDKIDFSSNTGNWNLALSPQTEGLWLSPRTIRILQVFTGRLPAIKLRKPSCRLSRIWLVRLCALQTS